MPHTSYEDSTAILFIATGSRMGRLLQQRVQAMTQGFIYHRQPGGRQFINLLNRNLTESTV